MLRPAIFQILSLENELMEVEIDKDKQDRSARQAKDRLREMEQDRKDLADEYVTLKTNYLTLTKSHEKEVKMTFCFAHLPLH